MRIKSLVVALVVPALLILGAANAFPQTPFPDDARQVLRQTIAQLQALANQHAEAGRTGPAVTILQEIRRLQALVDTPPALPPQPVGAFPGAPGMVGFRDQIGKTFRVKTTGSTTAAQSRMVWGTDTYTDDSDLSAAVVHAGLLAVGQEGEVLITFVAGQDQYPGSLRNGVTSGTWPKWPASYKLARVNAASASIPVLPAPNPAVASTVAVAGIQSVFVVPGVSFVDTGAISNQFDEQTRWQLLGGQVSGPRASSGLKLEGLRGRVGESFELEVTGSTLGNVWGDGEYTDDSELGAAAVHAGVLVPGERGTVRVTIVPGRSRYESRMRNGVISKPFENWLGSYRIESAEPR